MSRYERNVYFEKLVTLKLRPWGDADRTSVISIEDVIIYAEAVMLATEMEVETAAAEDAAEPALAEAAAPIAASTGSPAPIELTDTPSAQPGGSADRTVRHRRLIDGWFGMSRAAQPDVASDQGA